ncbi:serine hydrolase domain-containing protein [Nocardia stercoris]|uniref:Class A beta-lactamase-related serine hydrolase n=1 Tax=Nocardia stercoris TaxID=2483361 RepID=A0A3M2KQP4_9NOCA|nr:serine hydrolase domain-containing protein [Nocardia stercoris]RMI27779.1 class A beta-lactamase-related serine hydrolase [Nocardia stercoris]
MTGTLDPDQLQTALDSAHHVGLPGVFAEVRAGDRTWCGAAGVADLDTGRPVTAGLRHRVGSLSKTFTAAAVLQQADAGEIDLDTAIGHYLPRLVPGDRGTAITVRMLIDHTSGLAEYLPRAYPSLAAFPDIARTTPQSLNDHQFTGFDPTELIELGVGAPPTGAPGSTPGAYSNTNYLLLGQLLELVTGVAAEKHITRAVIERAELRDTEFPAGPDIDGPHARHYESWFGMFDPPADYSRYDMSWVGPAAALISTVADLNRFYRLLLAGEIVSGPALAQMQRTVPVISFEGKLLDYGLGLQRMELPGLGTYWGHEGSVWGGGAISMISADGTRQLSLAVNLQRWNRLGVDGKPQPHRIDAALRTFVATALAA